VEETKPQEEVLEVSTPEEIVEPQEEKKEEKKESPVKSNVPDVKYREVVYLGVADEAERVGAVTGNTYLFHKDSYGMPGATQVDERDYAGLIAEKGKGCARRSPMILFMSKLEWDLELEQARIVNNS
jgi:hypothetical protein